MDPQWLQPAAVLASERPALQTLTNAMLASWQAYYSCRNDIAAVLDQILPEYLARTAPPLDPGQLPDLAAPAKRLAEARAGILDALVHGVKQGAAQLRLSTREILLVHETIIVPILRERLRIETEAEASDAGGSVEGAGAGDGADVEAGDGAGEAGPDGLPVV